MRINYIIILFSVFVFLPGLLLAGDEQDKAIDTLELSEVVIKGERVLVPAGFKSTELDTGLIRRQSPTSLDQLLQGQSSLYFKNYGPSNISTPSFRGTSASQTAIYWDDIALNSPTLGSIDFSLVQTGMFNDMEIHYGSSSMVDGSGALGGAIHLDNRLAWSAPLSIEAWQTGGSFVRLRSGLSAQFGTGDWKGKTVLFYKRGKNDFSYVNPTEEGNPVEVQQHARVQMSGLLQQLHHRLDQRNALSIKAWIQGSDRDIPPTLAEETSQQTQNDFAARMIAGWRHLMPDGLLNIKGAYLLNNTNFRDGARQLDSDTRVRSMRGLAKFRWRFTNGIVLNSRLNVHYDQADSDGYAKTEQRTRSGLYAGLVYEPLDRLTTSVSFRQEVDRNGVSPFSPAIGLTWRPLAQSNLKLRGNVSRNYRVPTMNDLYWEPGGNRDLNPEKSWNMEGGISWEKQWAKRWRLQTEVTGYHSRIHNWIQWEPTSKGYWEAKNLKTVWTGGVEGEVKLSAQWNKVSAFLSSNYSYTRSVNMPDDGLSMKEGEQLIYVPLHQSNVRGGVRWKGFTLTPAFQFTGKRYVSTDNATYLPSYTLVNLHMGKNFRWDHWQMHVSLTGHNLMNTRYFSVVNRPMPGRWIEATVKVEFAKPE